MDPHEPSTTKRFERCILGTCCIPWTNDFALNETAFRRSIRHIVEKGTPNVYIFGTAGEGHAVSDRQFDHVTQIFVDEMRALSGEPMVGVISTSFQTVLERIEKAANIGARQFQITLPSWGVCNRSETTSFFLGVCQRFPELQFIHYNVARAGRLVDVEQYDELASALPNLVGVKYAAVSLPEIIAMRYRATPLRMFLTEFAFAAASQLGVEAGLLASLVTMNWRRAHEFFDAGVVGNCRKLGQYAEQLHRIHALLIKAAGTGVHMDTVFDQILAKTSNPDSILGSMPPYESATQPAFDCFITSIRDEIPDWLPNG
ncbi:MAG: dihydrodipicolinate synthase family protein [Pirellulales bacterium]|nr:dihydrodipicolinate synthase family protein [Pirellulales bacterium]